MRPCKSSNGSWEVPIGRKLWEVRLGSVRRIDHRRYEVQDTDERGYMVWYSGESPLPGSGFYGNLTKTTAVKLAESRPLPEGHKRVVRHVGCGDVVWAGEAR